MQHLYPPPKTTLTTKYPPRKHQIIFKNQETTPTPHYDPTISYTSLISRHCRNGHLLKSIAEFTRMRLSGAEPNDITFITLLSGCAHFPAQARSLGPGIHGYALKIGVDSHNVKVGTAIIHMYSKFGQMGFARLAFEHMGIMNIVSWNTMIDGYMMNGCFDDALMLFDKMPDRDVVSWTVVINGLMKRGRYDEALDFLSGMQLSGVVVDKVVVVSVLSVVANLGMIGIGLWLHRFVMKQDYKDNIWVNNSLIDMYCRCGCVELACQVFKNMPSRSIVTWNSIIVGLAVNGYCEEALEYFDSMQKDGIQPDGVSFTGALSACSHSGFVDQGIELFERMKKVHRIVPSIEHYGCLVDLYSRSRRLEDALRVIRTMPMKPNEVVLGSLLAACKDQGDVILAENLMNHVLDLDPGDSSYVLLSNIYAAGGSWQGASNVRRKMKALGIQKRPGVSSIEVNCAIHEFKAGDKSHVDTEYIYAMLELLSSDLHNI